MEQVIGSSVPTETEREQVSYTYEEVREASIKYFNGDELAAEVFAGKYALTDPKTNRLLELTPADMHRRLAKEFARIEAKYPNPMTEDEIYELLADWRVVPQGSPMSAIGNPYQYQSLSNCFVIESPQDSYGGILRADQEQAQIMKRRGGVGFDVSTIRPRGITTSNAAKTTDGIGVFMERFSNTCREVAQGGRRGALMLTIDVHHPEIRTFINIKRDLKKVTGANISIRVSDEFMNAVKNKTSVQLRFPVEKNVEHSIEAEVDATELWNEMMDAAWSSAEPGIIFWDTVLKNGPADCYPEYVSKSTNPCLTGDTQIAVADGRGYVPIKQLADEGKDLPVYCYNNETGKMVVRQMRNPRLTGEDKLVYKVTIEGGHTFKATGNHTMIMRYGSRKRVDELEPGDDLWTSFIFADRFQETVPGRQQTEHDPFKNAISQGYAAHVINNEVYVEKTCEWCNEKFNTQFSRREISFCSDNCYECYSNDKTKRTGVKEQTSIYNYRVISVEHCGYEDVYNGTVDFDHTLCIAVGNEKLDLDTNATILLASEQCGEITLSPYDSCRLLIVNLAKFVRHEFHEQGYFDYEEFDVVVQKAQRLMDDLVDLELEAVDKIIGKIENDPEPDEVKRTELLLWQKIRKAASGGRRTGLGITALGDTLAMMNCRYGDERSVNLTASFYEALAKNAYQSSINMAKERGAFPVFNHELEKDNRLINAVIDIICPYHIDHSDDNRCEYLEYGRRNIALTTTAPAGSVSILTQTTSGCEPVFMLSYKRRRKITAADLQSRVDFVDAMGDRWQEYTVYHPGFKRWMEVRGKTEADVKESPYYGSTANEIDWVKKVDIQAAAQRWICHSISNTTNIPKDTPVDVVKQIYMRGWETGCKGITVYRDGCRDGVLIARDEAKPADNRHAPKRPKELPCDIHRTTVNGVSYLVLVGINNGKPYEVFCGLQECIEIPKKAKTGTLTKRGKVNNISPYNLTVAIGDDDELTVRDVVTVFNNPEHGSITRVISLALRHGVPMQYLVEQLKKDKNSDLQSFSNAITRVLKNYIRDGEKASEKTCGQCGADGLIYQDGCVSCSACGWSKC